MKKFFVALLIAVCFSCTNEDASYKTLVSAGYSNIEFHGVAYNQCADDDYSCTEFTALGPTGVPTHGAVGCGSDIGCSGKGCTIRIR